MIKNNTKIVAETIRTDTLFIRIKQIVVCYILEENSK